MKAIKSLGGPNRTATAMCIPTVDIEPDKINDFIQRLSRDGHRVEKLASNGKRALKMVHVDTNLTRLMYVPTSKSIKDASIMFKDVWEILESNTATKNLTNAQLDEESCFAFAIILRNGKTYEFIVESDTDRHVWTQSLAFLVRSNRQCFDEDPEKLRILELWLEADKNNDKKLSQMEIAQLLHKLNVDMPKSVLKAQFRRADVDGSGQLDYREFTQFFNDLTNRDDLRPIFDFFVEEEPKDVLKKDELLKFFKDGQGEDVGEEVVDKMVAAYSTSGFPGVSFRRFCRFLLDPRVNSWFNPRMRHVYQDMTQPLHCYYIDSSHNTYLSGDQLQSHSKTEMYKTALLKGCRCVEIDCWDGPHDDPVVYHGYTKTSKIRFRDVIQAVVDNAFINSPYPVILSLEVHTSVPQQTQMARYLRNICGERLYTHQDAVKDHFSKWSPDALKGKILVKGRLGDGGEDEEKDMEGAPKELIERRKAEKMPTAHSQDLLNCTMVAARKSNDWGATAKNFWVTSFVESKIDSFYEKERSNFTAQTSKMLARVYPAGLRIDSSNYDPMTAWAMGAQLVALNYQTWDGSMRVNEAKFQQNGHCGYLLKPQYLRDPANMSPPDKEYTLNVRVIGASQLPKPNNSLKGEVIDPYVTVILRGPPGCCPDIAKRYSTKHIENNGFNPYWNEVFSFKVKRLDQVMLTLRVMDKETMDKDEGIAEGNVTLSCLRLGYRSVPLMLFSDGSPLDHASLLCHFSMEATS